MKKVIFELTASEKEELEHDLDKYMGGEVLMPPIDYNPYKALNAGKIDPNEKQRYRARITPLFLGNAPKWEDKLDGEWQ